MTNKTRDYLAAALFLILGVVAIFILVPQGVKVPSSVKTAALSPDFWPRIIAMGAVVASLALLVEAKTLKQPPALDEDEEDASEYTYPFGQAAARALILIGALFIFYASLRTIGVVAASIILIGVMMLFFGERKYWLVTILAVGVPIMLYIFFRYVARVPIPLGIFGG